MNYQINIANKLLNENILDAKAYGEQWVHHAPKAFEALHFCGLIHAKLNEMSKALSYFIRALQQNPNDVACHNNLSNVYLALEDTEKALQHLHQALRIDPMHPEAYNNFGRLLYKQGRVDDAIPHFQKALRINPDYWEAHYNLAHSFAYQNQMNMAATHYQEVVRLVPTHPVAHFNLGLANLSDENYQSAEIHLSKAFELMPNNLEAAKQLGQVRVTLGKIEEAIQAYHHALDLSSELPEVQHNLAILYLRNQDHGNALTHFKAALALDPNNDTAKHMIMSLSNNQTSLAAPEQYVVQLFDQYADYYDEHVKSKLKYAVPGLLRAAVGQCLTAASYRKVGRVLDLGCGTGLCGIFFRDLAVELIGIDVSEKMIERAKLLNAYEKLEVAEINGYLTKAIQEIASSDVDMNDNTVDNAFDIIIAGDVLVYTGDLTEIFANVEKALASKGRFAFTVEHLDVGYPRYYLQSSGRYAHHDVYIQSLAQQNGLEVEYKEKITPREQEGQPIVGCLYVLVKS